MWRVYYKQHIPIGPNFAAQLFDPQVYGAFSALADSEH